MKKKFFLENLLILTVVFCFYSTLLGGVQVRPTFLFMNASQGSIPFTVRNPGDKTIEVWLELKFGYVTSDDTGSIMVFYDTLGIPPQSAVPWIKLYPQRFTLEPLKSQIVRIMVSPPPSTADGEYWARILIANQEVKTITSPADIQRGKSGIKFIQKIGVPFHYRKGVVTTGISVTNFEATVIQDDIWVEMNIDRIGNAAYWGGAMFTLIDSQGKRILSSKKDLVVYDNMSTRFKLDRSKIKPGTYTMTVDISTDLRTDIRKNDMIPSERIQLTKSIVLN